VNQELRDELVALAERDQAFLASPGSDWNSDKAQQELLQLMGAIRRRLVEILDEYGWPGRNLVGEDGARAAWTLALHTMPEPPVLRRCLALIQEAAPSGEAEPWQVAFLVDRLSLLERGVQIYGTTICRQEDGSFGPPSLEDPDHVDERRREVGLIPLEQDIQKVQAFYVKNREVDADSGAGF
jgi:hypothetical protein